MMTWHDDVAERKKKKKESPDLYCPPVSPNPYPQKIFLSNQPILWSSKVSPNQYPQKDKSEHPKKRVRKKKKRITRSLLSFDFVKSISPENISIKSTDTLELQSITQLYNTHI
jgi:hypothetical protein